MSYEFWCSKCLRTTDNSCFNCNYFSVLLADRIQAYELLLLKIKDIYDNVSDPDEIKTKVRLNCAQTFDTSIVLFDDFFHSDYTIDEIFDTYSGFLPEQFDVNFF